MENHSSIIMKSIITGMFGAFIFGSIFSFTYFLTFTDLSHASFTLRPFIQDSWVDQFWGEIVSLIIIILLGAIPGYLYYATLKKLTGWLPGFVYGLVIWGIVYIGIGLLLPNIPPLNELGSDTIVTSVCLAVLYGVFVGYTISYDYHGERLDRKMSQNNE
ncbi:YqhR family membrane protein [Halalkalibacillus halophilus]|uniref:YqhR family membrane protein n=1 Tax=Halalkalibacillus halophilus TaxID=392827 RepID=UPI000425FDD8|nr:YqhR family membrane protein [Halalkalibacillus halophilus]